MLDYSEIFRHEAEIFKPYAPAVSLLYTALAAALDTVPSCYHGDMIRAVLGIPEPPKETEAPDA